MDEHDLTAAYALDALSADERERFEAHLGDCTRCRDELEGFWTVSAALARAAAGPPPPVALRERILTEARRDLPNVVPFRRRFMPQPVLGFAAAAAAVAAIALGAWATSLASEVDELRGELQANTEAVAILSDPAARQLPLSGADGRLVVARTGRAALVLAGIDRAPEGKTYEIWVIERGKPTPAGLFDAADTHTVVPVGVSVSDDAVVAVTLENEGGVDVPSGSPLFSAPPA
jgi:anti-sigma-K factor RskA